MRIIAGRWRGRTLSAPKGKQTRPTTDRVREALFSSLYSQGVDLEGAKVLDGFAGSGALGLEALSRGAATVIFNDHDRAALEIVQRNIDALGPDAQRASTVRSDDSMKLPAKLAGAACDVVFFDPPYAMAPEDVFALIEELISAQAVAADAFVVYEHDSGYDEDIERLAQQKGLEVRSTKRYGKSSISILEVQI